MGGGREWLSVTCKIIHNDSDPVILYHRTSYLYIPVMFLGSSMLGTSKKLSPL